MKSLLRSRAVQAMLAWLVVAYTETIIATLRWRIEDRAATEAAVRDHEGLIIVFWHGRIAQAMACRPFLRDKPRRAVISLSRDGGFIAWAAERLRFPTVRGSTGRSDEGASKGGASAFRLALKAIGAGEVMLLTPDGPRGPNEVMHMGLVRLARAAGCPVFLLGLAAAPALRLGSWDAARIPLPFARAALVLDGPVFAPAEGAEAALEFARTDWQSRMRAAQAKAEALLGGNPP